MEGKHRFDRFAALFGIKLEHFRADNHPFASKEFKADLEMCSQTISYSGVGAHFQNGVSERAIQTITYWTRAMMMHQLLHWPDQFDPRLWAFAFMHAAYIWNNMPKERHGLTPSELFTGMKNSSHDTSLLNLRIWGVPSWVLDPQLQDGHRLPKFSRRSHCGMYLGSSPVHSDTIGRILNLKTGHVSPQFHVVYDEKFATAVGHRNAEPPSDKVWNDLLDFGGHSDFLDSNDLLNPTVQARVQDLFDSSADDLDPHAPVSEGDTRFSQPIVETSASEGAIPAPEASEGAVAAPDGEGYRTRYGREVKQFKDPMYAATCRVIPTSESKLPGHDNKHKHFQYHAGGEPNRKVRCGDLENVTLHGLDWNPETFSMTNSVDTKRVLVDLLHKSKEGTWDVMALAAKSKSPDTFTYGEAMNGPHAKGMKEAAHIEINTLRKMGVWDVVKRQPWMNVLPSTWTFRLKRFTDGAIRKLKGRFCARGDRQIQDVDFFDTWAPVVSWNTVRLLLVLSSLLNLATRQVDYTAAFVHADIDKPPNWKHMSADEQERWGVYLEMPKGFQEPGMVLKLKKSLYGLRQAPRLWGEFLKKNLEAVGFEQAIDVDACLFISDKVICLTYVDDTLFFAKNLEDIDAVILALREKQKMTLDIEDDVAGFLGVQLKKDTLSGTVTMTQTGLIDRIITALGCDDLEGVKTPAIDVLGKDLFGDPATCTFNYQSVIGMIWYLERHTRPDISFATSQCARFSFNPKRSHELAMIRIGQYLKKTRTMGLIYKPLDSTSFKMDVHVDSDSMGIYGKELRSDPDNVKSRTGYTISLNGCPIIWGSKLQDSISLSTMMAEYYALSSTLREALPFRNLIKVVARATGLNEDCATDFKTTVWEDNSGALILANSDPGQHTPRSKFYDCKVHWFRSYIKDGSDRIQVVKIDTKEQLADIFTKPLDHATFSYLREQLMGW